MPRDISPVEIYVYRMANIVILWHIAVLDVPKRVRWWIGRYQKHRALLPLIMRHEGKMYVIYVTMKRYVTSDWVHTQTPRA